MSQPAPLIELGFCVHVGTPGVPQALGSRQNTFELRGVGEQVHDQIRTLAAGGVAEVWARLSDPMVDVASIYIVGAGVLDVHVMHGQPTSSTNWAWNAATVSQWFVERVSDSAPWILARPDVQISPTVKTASDTAGSPALWAAGDVTDGFVYRIVVKNVGSDPVTYRFNASSGSAP